VTDSRRGALLVAAAAICWSTGGLLARLVATDAWTTTFWRCLFSAAFITLAVSAARGGGAIAQWRGIGVPGVAVALCLATASTCFILSLSYTSVANTSILMSVGPYAAGLLGWIVLGERVRLRTWATMAVTLTGVVIMVSASYATGRITGDLLALAVAGVFAMASVLVRRHPDIPMASAAGLGALFAVIATAPIASPLAASPRDVALLALFGIGQLGVGFLLFTRGARLIPVAEASLIGMLEIVLGPLWVWLLLGENPGGPTLVGGAVILTALAVHAMLDLRPVRLGASKAPSQVTAG
jgi:drug/metabolite transporter (DMT)-like permease